jgi:uncharacterized membrane-anchored protein
MPDRFTPVDPLETFVVPAWFERLAEWIKTHSRAVLVAGVTFQVLVLVSMIAIHAAPLVVGERILLHVQPVDPRDFFRGDYVILAYDFSRVPPGGIRGAPTAPSWRRGFSSDSWLKDRTVYVSLEPESDGLHYRAGEISVDRPKSGRYIKGRYANSWGGNQLQFGIEAFYVQEGTGKVLEKLRNANQLSAEIALAPWGQATLCALK